MCIKAWWYGSEGSSRDSFAYAHKQQCAMCHESWVATITIANIIPFNCATSLYPDELHKVLKMSLFVQKAVRTGEMISDGTFSSIVELRIFTSGEVVAGKVLKASHLQTTQLKTKLEEVTKNIEILTKLSHENIVRIKGVCFLPDQILPVLLMERVVSSLQSIIQRHLNSLSVNKRIAILRDIASGLQYLHNLNPPFIHGHLTAENILVNQRLKATIGGLSIISNSQRHVDRAYMPPEAQEGSIPSDPRLDVFSFGHLAVVTTLQERVELPYESSEPNEVERRATSMKKAEKILSENQSLFDLIKVCLSNIPAQRPSTIKILQILREAGWFPCMKKCKK